MLGGLRDHVYLCIHTEMHMLNKKKHIYMIQYLKFDAIAIYEHMRGAKLARSDVG